jgi:hypothetical protein
MAAPSVPILEKMNQLLSLYHNGQTEDMGFSRYKGAPWFVPMAKPKAKKEDEDGGHLVCTHGHTKG